MNFSSKSLETKPQDFYLKIGTATQRQASTVVNNLSLYNHSFLGRLGIVQREDAQKSARENNYWLHRG